jgi:uncharacterized protein YdiU (UPF0061 family)
VGFVHGVMNTDNMSILGLTIDYGPYGWLESYDPAWTPNTTDAGQRRYRFGNQPMIAWWNLLALAKALAVAHDDHAALASAVETYRDELEPMNRAMVMAKLGLADDVPGDDELLESLQTAMTTVETDLTLFFRLLATVDPEQSTDRALTTLADAFYAGEPSDTRERAILTGWLERYLERARQQADRRARMDAVNPLYVPRNYLLAEVIDEVQAGDREALPELLDVLRRPYELQPGREAFARKRPEWARHRAGCSMLSCSS